MSLQMRNNVNLLEYKFNNDNINFDDKILTEELHVFNQQYTVSKIITNEIVNCLKNNKDNTTVDISKYNLPLKNIAIRVGENNLLPGVNASITTLDKNGSATIVVNIYKYYNLLDDINDDIFNSVNNSIAHELMHGHFILNQYNNSNNIDKTSSDNLYRAVVNYIRTTNNFNDVYYISYAIYCVFGNELNAFVSQCYGEVYSFIQQQNIKNNNQVVRNALFNSNVYKTFYQCRNNMRSILNYTDEQRVGFLNRFKSSLGVEIQNKILNNTLYRLNEALKMCSQTAMKAYYDINKQ